MKSREKGEKTGNPSNPEHDMVIQKVSLPNFIVLNVLNLFIFFFI